MEHSNTFDLNRAVKSWRDQFSQSPAFRGENLEELESHLGDSVDALQISGLSTEEAFVIATRRIGREASLEAEYGKINIRSVWLDRFFWMLVGIQAWGMVAALISALTRNALTYGWINTSNLYQEQGGSLTIAIFTAAHLAAIVASLAICWWLMNRNGSRFGNWMHPLLERRWTLIATCLVLCLITFATHLLSYGAPMVWLKLLNPSQFAKISAYSIYAQTISWPVQTIAMIAVTLAIARKRYNAAKMLLAEH